MSPPSENTQCIGDTIRSSCIMDYLARCLDFALRCGFLLGRTAAFLFWGLYILLHWSRVILDVILLGGILLGLLLIRNGCAHLVREFFLSLFFDLGRRIFSEILLEIGRELLALAIGAFRNGCLF